jgi:hypothetical protein
MSDELLFWKRNAAEIGPGWSPYFFKVSALIAPAYGWVMGPFGVFESTMETDNHGVQYLSALVHLNSSTIIAFARDKEDAATAGILAARVVDWSKVNFPSDEPFAPRDSDEIRAMEKYWVDAGLRPTDMTIGVMLVWQVDHTMLSTELH